VSSAIIDLSDSILPLPLVAEKPLVLPSPSEGKLVLSKTLSEVEGTLSKEGQGEGGFRPLKLFPSPLGGRGQGEGGFGPLKLFPSPLGGRGQGEGGFGLNDCDISRILSISHFLVASSSWREGVHSSISTPLLIVTHFFSGTLMPWHSSVV